MRRGQFTWIIVITLAIIVSAVLLFPTLEFYTQDPETLKIDNPSKYYSLKSKALRLAWSCR
jgi:hypothetical protein